MTSLLRLHVVDMMPSAPTRARKMRHERLSPAEAHEFDILRAAKMGIDISHLKPDERCKYPSRFCCHKRVRKSTGKLHRFCEFHRSRANVNQKRWTEIRRRQDHAQQLAEANEILMNSELTIAGMQNAPTAVPLLIGSAVDVMDTSRFAPLSPTCVDEVMPMSDEEIESLMTLLVKGDALTASNATADDDDWLASLLIDSDHPSVTLDGLEGLNVDLL